MRILVLLVPVFSITILPHRILAVSLFSLLPMGWFVSMSDDFVNGDVDTDFKLWCRLPRDGAGAEEALADSFQERFRCPIPFGQRCARCCEETVQSAGYGDLIVQVKVSDDMPLLLCVRFLFCSSSRGEIICACLRCI